MMFVRVTIWRGCAAPCLTDDERQGSPGVLVVFLKLERLPNNLGGMCEQPWYVEPPVHGVAFHSHQK
jgi:hypothetical protein